MEAERERGRHEMMMMVVDSSEGVEGGGIWAITGR